MTTTTRCDHTKAESWWINDGHGIPLARVCAKCKTSALAKFRPDIMLAYDHDEPLDED